MPFLQRDLSAGATSLYTTYTPAVNDGGFTELPTPLNVVYMSSSTGNDSNDGSSEGQAIFSKTRLSELLIATGNQVRQRCGDDFEGFSISGIGDSSDPLNPTVFTWFGDPADGRPRWTKTSGGDFNPNDFHRKNVWLVGIDLYQPVYDPDSASFPLDPTDKANNVNNGLTMLGGSENILYEDCVFRHTKTTFQGWDSQAPSNLKIKRNVHYNVYNFGTSGDNQYRPSNVFIADCTSGFEIFENFEYRGGWNPEVEGAGATYLNHAFYIQAADGIDQTNDGHFWNNIICDSSGYGIHFRPGGIVEDCLLSRNTVQLSFGYDSTELDPGDKVYAVNNVLLETSSYYKGLTQADIDASAWRSESRWGLVVYSTPVSGNVPDLIYDNNVISQLDPNWTTPVQPSLTPLSSNGWGTVTDNDIYHFNTPTEGDGEGWSDPERLVADWYQSVVDSGEVAQWIADGIFGPSTIENNASDWVSGPPGANNYEKAMNMLASRRVGQWANGATANAINNFIRAGFDKAPVPYLRVY